MRARRKLSIGAPVITTKADIYAELKGLGVTLTSSQLKKVSKPELQKRLDEKVAEIARERKTRNAKRATVDLDQDPTKDEPKAKRAPRSSANAAPASNVVSIKKPAAALDRPVKPASAFRPVKEGSKRHLMAQAMLRPQGATLEELMAVTGWDRNTTSGAVIWDLHTCMGLGVRRDGDRYLATVPDGITSIVREQVPVKMAAHKK